MSAVKQLKSPELDFIRQSDTQSTCIILRRNHSSEQRHLFEGRRRNTF